MKMIVAIIRPERLQSVKDALRCNGIMGMTMIQVKGRGSQSGVNISTRTGIFRVDEIEKIMLEIVVEDDQKQQTIDIIKEAALTGHIGDGRIFVVPVEESIKVHDE
ncbi:MAG: P-II family nitrogen regulator [Candidatus Methanomethylophilaceae archaeon]|nr:nitrogen regulatory protein 1 [Candidatus Methanomethylophilaceae archaeon]